MKRRITPILILVLSANLVMFLIKFYIGIRTNCLSIYTDSINNLADSFSAIMGIIGIALLKLQPTKKHPFGFGRVEHITGFIMAIFMTCAGFAFAYNSLERFFVPTPIFYFTKYLVILTVTCMVKIILGVICWGAYKKDKSPILKTVTLDSFLDSGITAVAVVSFIVASKTSFMIDSVSGIAISIIIAISGIKLIISSISFLIGNNDEETKKNIKETIVKINNTIEISKLLIHNYGNDCCVAEIHLNGSINIDIQKEIKSGLKNEFGLESVIEWEENHE